MSTIVPVWDGERYLREALDSILGQTRPPDEVIVVDDGSTDGTAAEIARFGDAVTSIRQQHLGIGTALNAGVEAASGDLLSFLDADDIWAARKTELQLAAMAEDPELDAVFGHVEVFVSPELSEEQAAQLHAPASPGPGKLKASLLIRRDAANRLGPFSTELKVADFVDWYSRAPELGLRDLMLPEVVLKRRLHETNMGRKHREARAEYARVVSAAVRRRRANG